MRERFASHGSKAMQTHELLEMLLYTVIPYKDTNPIAKRLIDAFGGIDGVFKASRKELMEVEGVGEAVVDLLFSASALMEYRCSSVPLYSFSDYSEIGDYVVRDLSDSDEYKVAIYLFDNKMCLIHKEILYRLDYGSGAVRGESFIHTALAYRAAVVISAHTHPHGPLFPLSQDIATNTLVTNSLTAAGVVHAEHFLVSGSKFIGIDVHTDAVKFHSNEMRSFFESKEKYYRERF